MVALFGIFLLDGSSHHTLYSKCISQHGKWETLPGQFESINRDEIILRVANNLQSIHQFLIASHPKSTDDIQLLHSDDALPPFEVGHFKLKFTNEAGFCFEKECSWLTVNNIGFGCVLDSDESVTDAEIAMRLIVQQLHNCCRVVFQPNDVILKVEKVNLTLNKHFPCGKITFLNNRTMRLLEKDSDVFLKVLN